MCVFVRVLVVFINSEIFGIIVKMSDVCSWLVALKKCKCNSKWILKYNFYLFIIRTATIKIVGYLHSGTNKYRSFHDPMCYTAPNWFQDSVSVLSVVLGLFMNMANVTSRFNDGQQQEFQRFKGKCNFFLFVKLIVVWFVSSGSITWRIACFSYHDQSVMDGLFQQ